MTWWLTHIRLISFYASWTFCEIQVKSSLKDQLFWSYSTWWHKYTRIFWLLYFNHSLIRLIIPGAIRFRKDFIMIISPHVCKSLNLYATIGQIQIACYKWGGRRLLAFNKDVLSEAIFFSNRSDKVAIPITDFLEVTKCHQSRLLLQYRPLASSSGLLRSCIEDTQLCDHVRYFCLL